MNKYLLSTYYVSDTMLCGFKHTHFIILTIPILPFYKANPVFTVLTIKALNFTYVNINKMII